MRYGHFKYTVMPFGLANAPATFQAYINRALMGLVDITCVVYLDNILIYSETEADHLQHVCKVLDRLREFELYANLKKCDFFTTEVDFLGYIVLTAGVSMDTSRVATIADWPTPKSFKDVQVFLGFANFYCRFIQQYSKIAALLSALLKGSVNGTKTGVLDWTESALHAFCTLCAAFTTVSLLRHFDPERKIRIETDTSIYAMSGILSQLFKDGHWHPIAFWSRKLIDAERRYNTYDQELLAIVLAMKHWRHYLEGSYHMIEVLTNHNNLKGFMNAKLLNKRQAGWATVLAAYNFHIEHRPGKANPAVAPSRCPDYAGKDQGLCGLLPTLQKKLAIMPKGLPEEAAAIVALLHTELLEPVAARIGALWSCSRPAGNTHSPAEHTGCKQLIPRRVAKVMAAQLLAYTSDSNSFQLLVRILQQGDAHAAQMRKACGTIVEHEDTSDWVLDSRDLLRYKGKLYIPLDPAMLAELLQKYHDNPLAEHSG